jgi:PAS domain S-box-containing protein
MADSPQLFSKHDEAVVDAARSRDQGVDAVIATDPSGRILYWNDAAAQIYGWSEAEVVGRNILDVTPTRGSGEAAEQIMEDMRHSDEWTGEFIVRHRDGTPMIAHVHNMVVRDDDAVVGVVGVSRPRSRSTPPRGD